MASSAKHFSLFLLLITSLSSLHTHARDSQFFNKAVTTTTNVVPDTKQPQNNQQEQPNLLPENENSYGLYSHESGQLRPSTTTTTTPSATTTATTEPKQPLHKYLPKNYNPVAYVTEPEDINDSTKFTEEKTFTTNPDNHNNYYNGAQNYYNNQQEEKSRYRSYYNGGSSFNSQPEGLTDTRFRGGATYNGGGFRPQPQGLSDTRFLENGKYFYDVNTEKYSSNHPYESLRGVRARNEYNNRNYYGNSGNAYEFNNGNSMRGYQNQDDEFQDEENNLP